MLPLTSNVLSLMGLTASAVVLGLVAVFVIQFLGRFARNILGNLNI
jgi:hypothetical protein